MKLIQVGLSWWICGPEGVTLERHGSEEVARARLSVLTGGGDVAPAEVAPVPAQVVEAEAAEVTPPPEPEPTARRRRRRRSSDKGA